MEALERKEQASSWRGRGGGRRRTKRSSCAGRNTCCQRSAGVRRAAGRSVSHPGQRPLVGAAWGTLVPGPQRSEPWFRRCLGLRVKGPWLTLLV